MTKNETTPAFLLSDYKSAGFLRTESNPDNYFVSKIENPEEKE